jgi:hypothetical protein
VGNAELNASLDCSPDTLDALAVTFRAWQAAVSGPAAIAIHDDRDMADSRSIGSLPGELFHRKRHVRLLRLG